jgi:hypothetical protein
MTHLSDTEFVDLIDGVLPAERRQHVVTCDPCRAQADALRSALTSASDAQIPEPSPLFWDHFSARVHEGVQEAAREQPVAWFARPTLRWTLAGTLATVVLVAVVWQASTPTSLRPVAPETVAPVAVASNDADIDTFDPDADPAWALVRTVADEATWDDEDATGLGVRPGAAERAMANLTHAERSELVRLLKAEMRM